MVRLNLKMMSMNLIILPLHHQHQVCKSNLQVLRSSMKCLNFASRVCTFLNDKIFPLTKNKLHCGNHCAKNFMILKKSQKENHFMLYAHYQHWSRLNSYKLANFFRVERG